MRIDAHIHLFTPAIIGNVSARPRLLELLHLQAALAPRRLGLQALETALDKAGLDGALMLPTAAAADVPAVNRHAVAQAAECAFLHTAGTLHPAMADPDGELAGLAAAGIRAVKFSSFSQRFAPDAPDTLALFERIAAVNRQTHRPFFAILDTFCEAPAHFGTDPSYITDPRRLGRLVRRFPDVAFVAAHMGGLAAPCGDILRYLPPAPNLYLDTSNAAHTLKAGEFAALLRRHGPERIIFGTDWPWFDPADELPLVESLLGRAGFSETDKARVFGGNIAALLGVPAPPEDHP